MLNKNAMASRVEPAELIRSAVLRLGGRTFHTARGVPFTLRAAPGVLHIHPHNDVSGTPRPVSFERLDGWIDRWFLKGDRDIRGYVSNGPQRTPSASFQSYIVRVFEHLESSIEDITGLPPGRERRALDNLPTPPASSDEGEPPAALGPEEGSLGHMLTMAKKACGQSGEVRTTVAKTKAFLFEDDAEFLRYISELLAQQQNRCAITNLPLQFVGSCEDEERLASLDRIDSDGHYARHNLQVVCRFINRWKNDDADQNFRRLIGLLGR